MLAHRTVPITIAQHEESPRGQIAGTGASHVR